MSGSRRLGTDKDVEKLARTARRAGWQVMVSTSNHLHWISPDGSKKIVSSLTWGDQRRIKRVVKALKDSGVDI